MKPLHLLPLLRPHLRGVDGGHPRRGGFGVFLLRTLLVVIRLIEGREGLTLGHPRLRLAKFGRGARLASGGSARASRRGSPDGDPLASLRISLARPPAPSLLGLGHVDIAVTHFSLLLRCIPLVPVLLDGILRAFRLDNLGVLHAVAQILAPLLPHPRLNLHPVVAGVERAHRVERDGAVTEHALDAGSAAALLANRARERVPFLIDVADAQHGLHRLEVVDERLRHPLRAEEVAPLVVARGFQRSAGRRAQAALRRPLRGILLLEDASLAVPVPGGYPHDAVARLVHRDVASLAEEYGVIIVRFPVPAHVAALRLFLRVLHGRHHLHLQLVIQPRRLLLVALLVALRLGLRRRRRRGVPAQLFLV